jgi:hypothetical protein
MRKLGASVVAAIALALPAAAGAVSYRECLTTTAGDRVYAGAHASCRLARSTYVTVHRVADARGFVSVGQRFTVIALDRGRPRAMRCVVRRGSLIRCRGGLALVDIRY